MLEHRCSRRLETAIEAVVTPQRGVPVEGVIRNIGRDGLFFETTQPLIRHQIVKISFHAPESSGPVIRSRAMVIHQTAEGVGLLADQSITRVFASISRQPVEKSVELLDLQMS